MNPSAVRRLDKVVIVEDDPLARARLCEAIEGEPNLSLAAAFDRARPAIKWLETEDADILLTDLGLPDCSGIEVIRACAARHKDCDIMVITMFGDEKNVLASIEAGAVGYILKDADSLDIGRAVRDLRMGGSPMSPLIARKVLSRARLQESVRAAPDQARAARPEVALTGREKDTLNLIARGYTYEETANLLAVSLSTVQTHVKSIYGKLAVNSRMEAVIEAQKLGLLQTRIMVD
jgi:DNA-binding NarL/FixJ family response regulator